MAKNYLVDYNSASVKNAEEMTRNIEGLLSKKKIVDQARFLTEDNITYSYTIKTRDDQIKYNILVNRDDELYKSKFDTLYFKTKSRLKSIKLFKTRIAAYVLAAGIGVTAYNLPALVSGAKKLGGNALDRIEQTIDNSRKGDGIYTKEEWDQKLKETNPNYNPYEPTKEDKIKALENYKNESITGQLEKMIEDMNEETKEKGL